MIEILPPDRGPTLLTAYPFPFLPDYIHLIAQARSARGFVAIDRHLNLTMPFILRSRSGIRTVTCLHVPCAGDGQRADPANEALFLEHFLFAVRRELSVHRITPPENWCLFDSAPANSVFCKFSSYVVDLSQDEHCLWTGLHPKHRNAVKAAYKSNVCIESGPHVLHACHQIYADTMKRNALQPHNLAFFKSLSELLPENILPLVSTKNGLPQSAALLLHTQHSGYYIYGGTVDGGADSGSNTLLHYHAMLVLKSLGVLRYDFVGARVGVELTERQRGIQRFKSRFGGELQHGFLWKKDLAPMICRVHDKAKNLRARLKGRQAGVDLIDQINAACVVAS